MLIFCHHSISLRHNKCISRVSYFINQNRDTILLLGLTLRCGLFFPVDLILTSLTTESSFNLDIKDFAGVRFFRPVKFYSYKYCIPKNPIICLRYQRNFVTYIICNLPDCVFVTPATSSNSVYLDLPHHRLLQTDLSDASCFSPFPS